MSWKTLLDLLLSDSMIKAAIFPGVTFIIALAMMTVWYERKLLARVALRIGPLHVGKVAGVFQLVGDGVKLIAKEVAVPGKALKSGFVLMPVLGAFIPMMIYPFLPFGADWIIFPSEIGLLLAFAVIAISPIPLLLAAWSSRSKYPFLGMLRLAFQLFAYEVPMFLALASVVVLSGTFNLEKIVAEQAALPYVFPLPLSFLVFFISSIAESERIPFDLPTAEQELVAGWTTEYSGILYELIMLSSYLKLNALTILTVLLFFGGWMGPPIPFLPEVITAPFWLLLKSLILLSLILLFRGVYPRITIDRLLDIGWRILIPLALINLFAAALLSAYVF